MTRRSPSPFLLSVLGLSGLVTGVVLGRGGPLVVAQVANPAQPVSRTVPNAAAKELDQDAIYQQLARQYEQFQHVNRTFELVARAVSPSVVHIVAQKVNRTEDNTRVQRFEETGSGVIVRGEHGRNLYILTNNHVIEGSTASKISVFLKDGQAIHPAKFWLDKQADIAVLDLQRTDLPAARLGDSDEIAVGSWVMALGSPFGLTHSVSQGIISARGRHMDELSDVENQDFLQTDAAINPGNSGGPLVNMKGEVIGINNSIASNGGGNEGVGFSIPINLARWVMSDLIENGRVSRGALGIELHQPFRPEEAIALGLPRPQGAWVSAVRPSSPAADGGLKADDVILQFNQTDVRDLNHLINMVSMSPIGQAVDLVIWRGGQKVSLRVKVGSRDTAVKASSRAQDRAPRRGLLRRPERPQPAPSAAMGMQLLTADETTTAQYDLPVSLRGVLITKVEADSPLQSILKPLDVLTSVNGHDVQTADEAVNAFEHHPAENPLVLSFDRVSKGVIEHLTIRVP
jgi:serine protease Do